MSTIKSPPGANATKPTPPRAPRRRGWRIWRVLALAGIALVAVVVLAAIAIPAWLLGTTSGLATGVQLATALTGVRIDLTAPQGSVINGFGAERVRVFVANVEVDVHNLGATLTDFDFRPLRFAFDGLRASRVEVNVRPSATPRTSALPQSIASPVAVSAEQFNVGEFTLRVGAAANPTTLGGRLIDGKLAIGPAGYQIDHGTFEFGPRDAPLRASVLGTLAGAAPFALDAKGDLASTLQDQPVQAQVAATGSLVDMRVNAQVTSRGAAGTAEVRVASFGTPALTSLRADLAGIDPKQWATNAPHADLRIEAELVPLPQTAHVLTPGPEPSTVPRKRGGKRGSTAESTPESTPPASNAFGLAGPVRIENRAPGTVDAGRIPARSATAHVQWRERTISAHNIVAQLVRGNARGTFEIQLGDDLRWNSEAQLDGVDPATIHSRLQPMRVDGSARVRNAGGDNLVEATLRNRAPTPATLDVDLRANKERVALSRAHLTLGSGSLEAQGELELIGQQRVHLGGRAQSFDPAVLVRGLDARLSGGFALDGTLAPRNLTAKFELTDSVALQRPLAGRGTVHLAGELLGIDADLTVRSAKVNARGGLGGAGRRLDVELTAPALQELLPQLRGAAHAQARLSGSWQQPAVEAQVDARDLRYANHAIDTASLTASYGGGSDGALALRTQVDGHRYAANTLLSLRSATLTINGRPSAHTLQLAGVNAEDAPVRLQASGGYATKRWQGRIEAVGAGAPLDLRMVEAAPLVIDSDTLRFGPARFEVAGARVDGLRVEREGNAFSTRGEFANFKPTELAALRPTARAIQLRPSGQRDPLTLRGNWQARLGQVLDASVLIERTAGDLYAGSSNNAMGVRELRAALTVRANSLSADAVLRGEQLGSLASKISAQVEHDAQAGWRLAQARPWHVQADADLPSIAWINTFLSDRVRASVRLRGQLNAHLRINGTPAQPRADGQIRGEQLRVAWIEQAVRLENGVLRAHVEGDTVFLDELRFSGAPRVQPALKRAAEPIAGKPEGFVAASGRLKLPDLTGYLQVAAERLPLVQRADRWVIATGGANIEFTKKRVQLNGAMAADAGYVDFSRPQLPSLSSDVVVQESSSKPVTREPAVAVGFDLGIALGDSFYLRGSGLDTRIAGAVRLRSDGQTVRATGALNAEDGTFEGYGQKLKITRGRVNFQGAPENPGLDILALRTDLPSEAGDIGVSITRTAANPLIRLYSDPPQADVQTLSWLVLGRPADQAGGDNIALARAAVGLLSGAGEGVPTTLARQLGIDEISLRAGTVGGGSSLLPRQSVAGNLRGSATGASTSGEIISVGKRVNEALTLSYEQSLSGVGGVVSLAYKLSNRLSLIARAGTEQGLDLVYSFAFD
jgi:translocation and assembly module TamB